MAIKDVLSNVINASNEASDLDPLGINSGDDKSFVLSNDQFVDGNGLPTTKARKQYDGKINRNIITWLVPEFGTVKMFINPQSISYNYGKVINETRTKGGYSLQYWGEELPSLSIQGTTGSYGIEGINLLYEIYRSEQYAFDGQALSLEASNYELNNYANQLANSAVDSIFGLEDSVAGVSGANTNNYAQKIGAAIGKEFLGTSPDAVVVNNSLAQLAFSVEMYYGGSVFRGFFTKFNIQESATNFAFDYSIEFKVTQQRGYRKNYFPFHKNPNNAPSRYSDFDSQGNNFDYSFKRKVRG